MMVTVCVESLKIFQLTTVCYVAKEFANFYFNFMHKLYKGLFRQWLMQLMSCISGMRKVIKMLIFNYIRIEIK
jgi:hypothetical protein